MSADVDDDLWEVLVDNIPNILCLHFGKGGGASIDYRADLQEEEWTIKIRIVK